MIAPLAEKRFNVQFERFKKLVAYQDKGHPFPGFQEGVAGAPSTASAD